MERTTGMKSGFLLFKGKASEGMEILGAVWLKTSPILGL